jgi:hypothetical protein
MPRFNGTPIEDTSTEQRKPRFGGKPVEAAADSLDWGDVPGQAAKNFLPSLGQMGSDMYQAVRHPVQTAEALGSVAGGVAAKAGIGNMDQGPADAVGKFFADRYGSEEGFKRALAEDPAGVLSDLGTVLTLGGGAAARAPGVAGKVAGVVGKVGEIVDPVSASLKVGGAVVRKGGSAAATALGMSTGVGGDAIREMAASGRSGNTAALEQMRNRAPVTDISDSANHALDQMRAERSAQFDTDMAPARADTTPLSFQNTVDALREARSEIFHNGKAKDTRAASVLGDLHDVVNEWQQAGLNTTMDLDALKQRVGEIRDGTDAGTVARRTADKVYNAVRGTAGPDGSAYDVAQKGYRTAIEADKELRKEFSLNEKSSDNTANRKLLSALRNNVNTNFGERERMMRELARREPALPGMIAGRNLSGWEPRGLARILGNPLIAGTGALTVSPWVLAALPAQSPRIAGEAAYAAGRAAGALSPTQSRIIARSAFQASRASEESKKKEK